MLVFLISKKVSKSWIFCSNIERMYTYMNTSCTMMMGNVMSGWIHLSQINITQRPTSQHTHALHFTTKARAHVRSIKYPGD